MDQSALLSVVGGMYDKLVQDVSNRVFAMMIETERARQPAEWPYNYQTLVSDVCKHVEPSLLAIKNELELDMQAYCHPQINYEALADQIDWKSFARDVSANFSASDIASEIDLGDLVTELDYGAIAEGLDTEKVADEIDMEEKVREVLRGL